MIIRSTIAAVLMFFTMTGLGAQNPGVLRIHGSNTVGAELAPTLAEAWLQSKGYGDVREARKGGEQVTLEGRNSKGEVLRVELEAHGSSTGFRDLSAGTTDIAMASRRVKGEEIERLSRFGQMDSHESEYVLGLDGIAVIVNAANPVEKLDTDTVAKIFTGEITDWSEVGGTTKDPIHVYARDENSGTFDTFKSLVLGKTSLIAEARRFESNPQLSSAVSSDRSGIGFVGLPYVHKSKALALSVAETRPIQPSPFSVATEDYVLARRLYLYVPTQGAHPLARDFAEFAAGPKGQTLVDGSGFVSQHIVAGEIPVTDDMPEEYAKLIQGAKRLSLNFRFERGSIKLDNKGTRDLDRLVAYMKRPENKALKVMLFGFADNNEIIPIRSLDLSVHRADTVAELLLKRSIAPTRVRGYGSVLPVASNETASGRFKNRRVEVWVK